MRKTLDIQSGDYVKGISGVFKGKTGWVSRTGDGVDRPGPTACVVWKGVWDHGIWVDLQNLKRTKRFKNGF